MFIFRNISWRNYVNKLVIIDNLKKNDGVWLASLIFSSSLEAPYLIIYIIAYLLTDFELFY